MLADKFDKETEQEYHNDILGACKNFGYEGQRKLELWEWNNAFKSFLLLQKKNVNYSLNFILHF